MRWLAEVVAIDRIPEWVRLIGHAAFDKREAAVRVADLELDSLLRRGEPPTRVRTLRFGSHEVSVTMRVTNETDSVSMAIRLRPPGTVGIDVRPLRGSVQRVWSDDRGCATCRDVPPGPLSLLVHWPKALGGPVRTAWVQV